MKRQSFDCLFFLSFYLTISFLGLLYNKSNKLNTNMGTLNYNTRYMKKKIQNIPYANMPKLDRLFMMMELAGVLGKFKDLDPREFGADYDQIIDDNKNGIYYTSRDF